MQMRRLADLAFMLQLYEIAYQTYHTAKRDFNNDHAWLYYAGALVCVATILRGWMIPCMKKSLGDYLKPTFPRLIVTPKVKIMT